MQNVYLRPIWIPALFVQLPREGGPDVELSMQKTYEDLLGNYLSGEQNCGREGEKTRLGTEEVSNSQGELNLGGPSDLF